MPPVWRPHVHRIIALASGHCAARNMIKRQAPHTPVQSSVQVHLPHLGGLRHAKGTQTHVSKISIYSNQKQLCASLLSFSLSLSFCHALPVQTGGDEPANTGNHNSIIQFQDGYIPFWAKTFVALPYWTCPPLANTSVRSHCENILAAVL